MAVRGKAYWLHALILSTCLVPTSAMCASVHAESLVGRIVYAEGEILRYVAEEEDWAPTVKDAPFGRDDTLYSDAGARAEVMITNGVRVRMGASTQLQVIALKNDAWEMDVASGVARFCNQSSEGVLKATTPFGYVLGEPESSFDLYVGDQSVDVVALSGEIDFVDPVGGISTKVIPGSGCIRAGAGEVSSDAETIDDEEWDSWNGLRDDLWSEELQVKGDAASFPPQIRESAAELRQNGKWERVYHEGGYRALWRPTKVATSWQPFTVGRWTDWYGDQCWVPDEPFGYVTHHYGNWVMVNGNWYWDPPSATAESLGWYPGRVAWIYNEEEIGWVPLAPTEVYYAHNDWGPQAVVVEAVGEASLDIGSLVYHRSAIVVPQIQFYSVPSYVPVRVTNINRTTIIKNFRSARVVDRNVVRDHGRANRRFKFRNADVLAKPHRGVIDRIRENRRHAAEDGRRVNAAAFRHTLAATKRVKPEKPARVPRPKLTNRMVPANQVDAPKDQVKFKSADFKRRAKSSGSSTGRAQGHGEPSARDTSRGGPGSRPAHPGIQTVSPGPPGGKEVTHARPPGTKRQGVERPGRPGPPRNAQAPGVSPTRFPRARPRQHVRPRGEKPLDVQKTGEGHGARARRPNRESPKSAEQIMHRPAPARSGSSHTAQPATAGGKIQPHGRQPQPAGSGVRPQTQSSPVQTQSPPRQRRQPDNGPPSPRARSSSTGRSGDSTPSGTPEARARRQERQSRQTVSPQQRRSQQPSSRPQRTIQQQQPPRQRPAEQRKPHGQPARHKQQQKKKSAEQR